MRKPLRNFFRFDRRPALLPPTLLAELVRRRQLLLCLDFDGTLSEISSSPELAGPVTGAVAALRALAAHHERVALALVSGRRLEDLRSIVPVPPGVALAGVHGLELVDWTGRHELTDGVLECEPELERARAWLDDNLPLGAGFVVEDKGIAVALHYRQAPTAVAHYVRDAFEQFILQCTSLLKPRHGKMVLEAIPKMATKAYAVRTLWQRAGIEFEPVYCGDDLTDEEAFAELAEGGITVLVGKTRRTAAQYRVESPADLVRALQATADSLSEAARQDE